MKIIQEEGCQRRGHLLIIRGVVEATYGNLGSRPSHQPQCVVSNVLKGIRSSNHYHFECAHLVVVPRTLSHVASTSVNVRLYYNLQSVPNLGVGIDDAEIPVLPEYMVQKITDSDRGGTSSCAAGVGSRTGNQLWAMLRPRLRMLVQPCTSRLRTLAGECALLRRVLQNAVVPACMLSRVPSSRRDIAT